MREYVRSKWGADCPLPSFLLASRSYGRSSDSGMSAAVFDWFLKGGNKDNIPDTEEALRSHVQASFEKFDAGKKGKPPPKKGKGAEEGESIPSSSALRISVIKLRTMPKSHGARASIQGWRRGRFSIQQLLEQI